MRCQAEGKNVFGWGEKPDVCPICKQTTTYAVSTFQAWASIVGKAFEWAFFYLLKEKYGINLIPAPPEEELFDFLLPPNVVIECKGSPSYILNPDGSKYPLGRPGLKRSDTRKKAFDNAKGFKKLHPDYHFIIVSNSCPKNLQGYSNEQIYIVRDISKSSQLQALIEELKRLSI